MIETENNFNTSNSIKIYPLQLYEIENAMAGDLRIVIDHSDEIYVVDIIDFTPEGKIYNVHAFLGRTNSFFN